jgi:hypothetical protein
VELERGTELPRAAAAAATDAADGDLADERTRLRGADIIVFGTVYPTGNDPAVTSDLEQLVDGGNVAVCIIAFLDVSSGAPGWSAEGGRGG